MSDNSKQKKGKPESLFKVNLDGSSSINHHVLAKDPDWQRMVRQAHQIAEKVKERRNKSK